jgi:MFS family permease
VTGRTDPARLLLVCCAISFSCFTCAYLRIPVLPLYAASLGADATRIGLINASFMLSAGLLSIPSGLVSDRVGRRAPILTGLFLLGSSSLLLYVCTTSPQLALVYLLFGVGLAAVAPNLMSFVADITPVTHLGRAYGWYTMALYAGMTLGPAAGGFLGRVLGLRQVFLVAGLLLLALFCFTWLFLPGTAPVTRPMRQEAGILRELAGLRHNRRYLACLVATLGSCAGFGTFISFLPLHARELGLNSGHTGLVFAAQALANSLCRLPFGRLGDRVGDRSVLVIGGLILFSATIAVTGLCAGLSSLVICAAVLGVGMGIAFTAIGALIAEVVPTAQRGVAMGGYNSCIYFGMMLGAAGVGLVIREAGYAAGFLANGALGAVVTGVFWWLCRIRT